MGPALFYAGQQTKNLKKMFGLNNVKSKLSVKSLKGRSSVGMFVILPRTGRQGTVSPQRGDSVPIIYVLIIYIGYANICGIAMNRL